MIIGNLTRDPEIRTTPSGQTVANFSVATNRIWTNTQGQKQEAVEYHNVVAWGKLAEICGQYLGKGRKVYVEGRLQTRDWEGQDGIKRYRTEIVAENMIMLDRSGVGDVDEKAGQSEATAAVSEAPQEEEIKVENIPF